MRCRACDELLTDYEVTRKSARTDEYLDLCNNCFRHIQDDFEIIDRPDLKHLQDEIELENYEDD